MGRPIKKIYFQNPLGGTGLGGESLASIAVGGGGANVGYTEIPVLQIPAPDLPGTQAVARAHMAVVGITSSTYGTSGYVPGSTLTFAGGTGTQGTVRVDDTIANSLTINARGTGYAPGDVLTVDSGTYSAAATTTVVTTRAKTVAINAAGAGGWTEGNTDVTVATGAGTAATITVTADAGGIATGVAIKTAGAYTTNPTLTGVAVVGGPGNNGGSLTLDLTMEIGTVSASPTTGGKFTVNPTLTASPTTVAPAGGTGATLNALMGLNTVTLLTGGDYTALPSNVAAVTHTGSGVGGTFSLTYKVLSAEVVVAGSGYETPIVITEVPDGGATYTATMTTTTANVIASSANPVGGGAKAGDILKQESSRRYRVATLDGTGQCTLVAHAPSAEGEMTIKAKDSDGGLYYVIKLTARRAVIVKGDQTGVQFVTGTDGISVPWVFTPNTAVANESVEIVSA